MSKLKIAIVTRCDCGMASLCLPALATCDEIELAEVLFVLPKPKARAFIFRKLRKMFKIGIIGAINGIRMRKWYADSYEPLKALCERYGIRFRQINGINSPEMQEALQGFDIALSLGNDYIAERIFTVPRLGMINVHSEILPKYQNAQSIIWPIYCEDPFTGFTIHEVSRKMDGGKILAQRRFPIEFHSDLERTVRATRLIVDKELPAVLTEVCVNIEKLKEHATPQEGGSIFTTPSIWQYLRMRRNNRKFWKRCISC